MVDFKPKDIPAIRLQSEDGDDTFVKMTAHGAHGINIFMQRGDSVRCMGLSAKDSRALRDFLNKEVF